MKLRKLIIPALLSLGVLGGVAFAGGEPQQASRVAAMADYTGDPDVDVGLNVQRSEYRANTWEICQFYVNSFESGDVSGGNYLALRIKVAEGAGSYFDMIPNVGGKPHRVTAGGGATAEGIKCVPAGPNNVAFDYAGARDFDLPMNLWSGADIWFCIPKTTFTRDYWGAGDIDWQNDTLWAVYFMFYGVTQDNVNFDIGNLWTADIDEAGHLVKINRLLNWANVDGVATYDTGDNSMAKLVLTRNSENLKPAVKFIQGIENVDVCNATAATAAYNKYNGDYDALNAANQAYLYDAWVADYANGDTDHEGGKLTGWTAIDKWAQICASAGHPISVLYAPVIFKENYGFVAVLSIATISAISFGLFFIIRKRRTNK